MLHVCGSLLEARNLTRGLHVSACFPYSPHGCLVHMISFHRLKPKQVHAWH